MRQLPLDRDLTERCFQLAGTLVSHARKYVESHSSVSVEVATLKLLGVEGWHRNKSNAFGVVSGLSKDQLKLGAAIWWSRAQIASGLESLPLAEKVRKGKVEWNKLPEIPFHEIRRHADGRAKKSLEKLPTGRIPHWKHPAVRCVLQAEKPKRQARQLEWLHQQGILHARLQYPQKGKLEEGLDEDNLNAFLEIVGKRKGEGVLSWHLSGVQVPETAVVLAQHGVNLWGLDGFTNALLHGVDLHRSLVDHWFAQVLAVYTGSSIQTYAADWVLQRSHLALDSLLALLFLQEQWCKQSGLPLEQIGVCFGLPAAALTAEKLTAALSVAQLVREIFLQSDLWWHWHSGSAVISGWVAALAKPNGVDLEWEDAEKHWGPLNAQLRLVTDLRDELDIHSRGRISRYAHGFLDDSFKKLHHWQQLQLWKAWEERELDPGVPSVGQSGFEGVFQKSHHYWNPVWEALKKSCPVSGSY